jgi:hypothetical protein
LAALGYEVVVDEDTGIPFTFRLAFNLNQTGPLTGETYAAARRVALANKNARSHLLAVRSTLTGEAGLHIGVAHYRAQTVTADAGEYGFTFTAVVTGGGSFSTGSAVTLACAATSGIGNLSLQWYLGGVAIEGATSSTYSFTLSDATDGDYTCVASNGIMEPVTSNTASVKIRGVISDFANVSGDGICYATNGNLYVTNSQTKCVYCVDNDGTVTTLASGLEHPSQICQGSDENIYLADSGSVKKITLSGTVSTFATFNSAIWGICSSVDGCLYCSTGTGYLVKLLYDGTHTQLGQLPSSGFYFIAEATSGNLYLTSVNIVVNATKAGVFTTVASTSGCRGISQLSNGKLCVTQRTPGLIVEMSEVGVTTTIATGLTYLTDTCQGLDGDLFSIGTTLQRITY